MTAYRVTKKSFLKLTEDAAPRLYKPGAVIEYDGPPGTGMEVIDDAEKKRDERARSQRREPTMAELPARVERLEDAVGQDAINAAAKKRADAEAAERKKAEDDAKAAADAETKKRADDRKAKDAATKKAEAKDAKEAKDPNIIADKATGPLASATADETTRTK